MDIFWYIVVCGLAGISYLSGLYKPKLLFAVLFYGCLITLAGLFLSSGIDIPGAGAIISGNTITFTSTSYTYSNSILVFAGTWLCLFLGIWGFWKIIMKAWTGELKQDGSFA